MLKYLSLTCTLLGCLIVTTGIFVNGNIPWIITGIPTLMIGVLTNKISTPKINFLNYSFFAAGFVMVVIYFLGYGISVFLC